MSDIGNTKDNLQTEIQNLRKGRGCLDNIFHAETLAAFLGFTDDDSDEYRTSCLLALIKHTYKDDRADNLLAALNLHDKYRNIKQVNKRRKEHEKDSAPESDLSIATLTYHENLIIERVVKEMIRLKKDASKLSAVLPPRPTAIPLMPIKSESSNEARGECNPRGTLENLPYSRNTCFTDFGNQLGQIEDYLAITPDVRQATISTLTLHGMGGAGKTQLALAYAYNCIDTGKYSVIWWLPADTKGAIHGQLTDFLEEQLKTEEYVKLRDRNDSYTASIRAFRRWFENTVDNWLLIFDDVYNMDVVESVIPRKNKGAGHILITTRLSDGGRGQALPVEIFDEPAAITFLEKRTGIVDRENAQLIAERLGYLPLALEQAAAYIAIKSNEVDYARYLLLLKENGLDILGDKYSKNPKSYKHTVATTWKITMDKFPYSSPARKLLNYCSYFAPDAIDFSLFIEEAAVYEPLFRDEIELREDTPEIVEANEMLSRLDDASRKRILQRFDGSGAVLQSRGSIVYAISFDFLKSLWSEADRNELKRELVEYSLMRYENGLFYIHRLLQEVIREEIGENNDYIKGCVQFLRLINTSVSKDKKLHYIMRNLSHILSLIGHVESMLLDEPGCYGVLKVSYFALGAVCIKIRNNELAVQMLTQSLTYCYDEYLHQEEQPDNQQVIASLCQDIGRAFSKMVWPKRFGLEPAQFRASYRIKDDMLIVQLNPVKKHIKPYVLMVGPDERKAMDLIDDYNSF